MQLVERQYLALLNLQRDEKPQIMVIINIVFGEVLQFDESRPLWKKKEHVEYINSALDVHLRNVREL